MNTVIIEKTSNGDISYDIFSKFIKDRILFINDFVDDKTASDIVATLIHLDREDNSKKISLYINSDGGDIRNIFMIYDTIKMLNSPVETFCTGAAMQEAVLLLAAGTQGMRYISENADLCINQISHTGVYYSDLTNASISHEKAKRDNDNFLKLLSKCIGKPIKTLKKDCERQMFLTAKEAKKYGIVDEIIPGAK